MGVGFVVRSWKGRRRGGEPRRKNKAMARILAIDYGRKRCGVAVTDPLRIIATALATVPAAGLWDFLKDYFAREDVDCVVVGEPRQMDNTPSHVLSMSVIL